MPTSDSPLSYRDAGVDIDAASRAMRGISALVRSTATPETLSGLGSFGGMYRVPGGFRQPVLVASTDGVGTKLKLAFLTGRHDTVGEDLVNHCVNDILVQGALPLFFLDYIGLGKLEPGVVESLVEGIARGCRANGCALLGGETAEMPDFYAPGEYDLAGTIVGIVEEDRILDGSAVREGDLLIALGSSGLHTNGYSLARRIVFERMALDVDDPFPGEDAAVGEVLLRTHRTYLPALRPLLQNGHLRALAHVTGGGITDNLPRVLPEHLDAHVDRTSWELPNLFRVLGREGRVEQEEMFRSFNMGVGMIAIVAPADADGVLDALREGGEDPWIVGSVVAGQGRVRYS
jgi:phosphoribosylformylglycinamidine cyclo-ligase